MNLFLSTLILFISTILLVFFLKKNKILIQWKNRKNDKRRIKIEDALKYLYNCEYNKLTCSLNSIAGSLSITSNEAANLIKILEEMGMIATAGESFILTAEGKRYALRVIRTHRLWEKYLADETSISETDWHSLAEIKEHKITSEEAENLSAQIGNPLFDPHGDPIPTAEGIIPRRKGIPLTQLEKGDFGKIVHLEDEPSAIYQQLVAEGLYIGQQVKLIDKNNERLHFEANNESCFLAPSFAKNVTVEMLPDLSLVKKSFKRLSDLKLGEKGVVVGISKACRGKQRRRLLDLGLVPGSVVKAEIKSVGGDPTGFNIRGALIAIRKKQSDQIFIKNESE